MTKEYVTIKKIDFKKIQRLNHNSALNYLREIGRDENLYIRNDGRIEWLCEHKIGHTIWYPEGSSDTHGCDGCCKKLGEKQASSSDKEK